MISREYGVREVFHAPGSELPTLDSTRLASAHSETVRRAFGFHPLVKARKARSWPSGAPITPPPS